MSIGLHFTVEKKRKKTIFSMQFYTKFMLLPSIIQIVSNEKNCSKNEWIPVLFLFKRLHRKMRELWCIAMNRRRIDDDKKKRLVVNAVYFYFVRFSDRKCVGQNLMLNDFWKKKSQVHFQNIQGSAFSACFFFLECCIVSLFTTLNPESFVKVESVKLFICSDW